MREISSTSHTIEAKAPDGNNIPIPSVNGYTPIGVVGIQNNKGGSVVITAFKIQNSNVFIYQLNTSNVAINVYEIVVILYAKSALSA